MARANSIASACAALALSACATTGGAPDAQTAAWWSTTEALSSDRMEGRDTGSAGYDRAAAYVRGRFERAGLRPAGDGDTYFQRISFNDIEVLADGTTFDVNFADGQSRPLHFLHEISVTPTWGMPEAIDAPLVFRGYCGPSDLAGVQIGRASCRERVSSPV